MDEKSGGLMSKLEDIEKKLNEQQVKKKFKLPLSIRMSPGKFKKQNYAIVVLVRMNGAIDFKMAKIEDNTIKVGDTFHDASADYIMRYKKYPVIILPEWNIKPFSPRKNLEEAVTDGSLSSTEKFILARMKLDALKGKMQLNFKIILILLAVGAGALYLLNYLGVI